MFAGPDLGNARDRPFDLVKKKKKTISASLDQRTKILVTITSDVWTLIINIKYILIIKLNP